MREGVELVPLESVTREHILKQFDLNVTGLLLTTKEALKLMGPDGGSIVNISSIVGPMQALSYLRIARVRPRSMPFPSRWQASWGHARSG